MPRQIACFFGLAFSLVGSVSAQPPKPAPPAPEPVKVTEVILGSMKALAPVAWKPEKPANRLRTHQFKIAKAAGDSDDAELYILPDVLESVELNFERLQNLFVPPPDMPKKDAVKQSQFKVGKATLHVLELQGTYHVKHVPIDQAVKEVKPDYRMIAVVWKSDKESYSIRVIGPKKTVEAHAKEFENWLKSFK